MNKNCLSVFVIAIIFLIIGCQKKEKPVFFKLDYSKENSWLYTIEYRSQGLFTQNDSTSKLGTVITCQLSGNPTKEVDKLAIKVNDVNIVSDMLEDDVKKQITEELSVAEYYLPIDKGHPSIDTDAKLPKGSFSEWDIYRQLAKVLPSLPITPVEPGFSWERTINLPINTIHGMIPCEVYQSYTFDSLAVDKNIAFASWEFRYAANQQFVDSIDVLKQIPIAGNGTGAVKIDFKRKILLSAEMDFKTPVATIGGVTVNWNEKTLLKYKTQIK